MDEREFGLDRWRVAFLVVMSLISTGLSSGVSLLVIAWMWWCLCHRGKRRLFPSAREGVD